MVTVDASPSAQFKTLVSGPLLKKPVAFEYCRPDTLEEVMELLTEFGGDASIISGGVSLGAMLNMRLVRPKALIDINHVRELENVEFDDATAITGALVRQAAAQKITSLMSGVPLLAMSLPWVDTTDQVPWHARWLCSPRRP